MDFTHAWISFDFVFITIILQTCHVKAGGTPCRETGGLCDLPEFCTGDSELCPEDVTVLDGLECSTPNGKVGHKEISKIKPF